MIGHNAKMPVQRNDIENITLFHDFLSGAECAFVTAQTMQTAHVNRFCKTYIDAFAQGGERVRDFSNLLYNGRMDEIISFVRENFVPVQVEHETVNGNWTDYYVPNATLLNQARLSGSKLIPEFGCSISHKKYSLQPRRLELQFFQNRFDATKVHEYMCAYIDINKKGRVVERGSNVDYEWDVVSMTVPREMTQLSFAL